MAPVHFSSWFYFLFLFVCGVSGGGGVRSATAIRTGTESKNNNNNNPEKNCCTSVIIQSLISPLRLCWSHYSQILQNRDKVPMITKWTSITVDFHKVFFRCKDEHADRDYIEWDWTGCVGWAAAKDHLSFWQHVDIMLWNLHHRQRGRASLTSWEMMLAQLFLLFFLIPHCIF